jgi:hypothetical protein
MIHHFHSRAPRHFSHAQIRSSDVFICDQRLRVAGELNPSLTEDVNVVSKLGGKVVILLDKQEWNPRSLDVLEDGFELLNDHRRQTVDVNIDRKNGIVRVPSVVIAADIGSVVNPNGARNQLEGGIVQASVSP